MEKAALVKLSNQLPTRGESTKISGLLMSFAKYTEFQSGR